jgi:hypothetical protein
MEATLQHPRTNVDPNLEYAIQTQQKFEFYFLALVFTILGLSIQTAKLSFWLQGVFEIAAWLSLLASGLAGLSRMEWIPVSYKGHAEVVHRRAFLQEANTGRPLVTDSGQTMSTAEADQFVRESQNVSERQSRQYSESSNVTRRRHSYTNGSLLLGLYC